MISTSTRFWIFFLSASLTLQAQSHSPDSVNRKRLTHFALISTATYGTTLYGLNKVWYSDAPRESFHFFNDNAEWKQVDKVGHLYSAFYLSAGASQGLKWAGMPAGKSSLYGSLAGALLLVPIEIMDGYSGEYGASAGDLAADFAGAGLFYLESRLWEQPRIYPKFSFHRTNYAPQRPDVLGHGRSEEWIKDYNGQTYWLSFDMDRFVSGFPRWLNLAAGYGAEGMLYARDGQNSDAGFSAFRQYYLGVDLDLTAIPTRSKFVHSLLVMGSVIRLPAPALEFSRQGISFKPLYF